MAKKTDLTGIRDYFAGRFREHGATPKGMDWNSLDAQNVRFDQLSRVTDATEHYSLLDYGCGYGALYDFLKAKGHDFSYTGFEIVEEMAEKGRHLHASEDDCTFTTRESELKPADYVVESGIFNIKLAADPQVWSEHVTATLKRMNALSRKGMAFNLLTSYSDPEFIRPDLYYADPCFYFDYCKIHFSRNVALLHDYQLYDFTILVRKDGTSE
jgi:SAM-dependent methyltransferase